jgi:hypothetical protein
MHAIQFVSMMMVIQMKLMKVIRKIQNMMIQEFQLDMESKLRKDSKTKMHLIQFVSMMMVIQRKLNQAKTDQKLHLHRIVHTNLQSRSTCLKSNRKQFASLSGHPQAQSLAE